MDSDRRHVKKQFYKDSHRGGAPNNPKKFNIVSGESKEHHKPKHHSSHIEPHLHLLRKYDNFDWNNQNTETLYSSFKELEKALKNMIESDPKQCVNIVSDYSTLRDAILRSWELIVLADINLAITKEIDKRLWAIIKKPIELLTKDKKKEEGHKENIIKLIDQNIEQFKDLIQKVKGKYNVQEEDISPDSSIRKLFSNLLSYLGELFQIRDKTLSHYPTLTTSIELYFRAISLYPYEGKYYMLLSNCSKLKEDLFGAIYWGVRAYTSLHFYPMKEQILKFLEEARLAYLTMLERDWLEPKASEYFKYFILSFLRYLNIILTKIGFEELYSVTNNMFEYLEKHIHYLNNENSNVQKENEANYLQQVIALVVYSLYHSIQGYNPKEEAPNKYLTPQEKGILELSSNDLAKECLKYSYGIVYHILEVLLSNNLESYLNVLAPLLYYLIEHKSVFDYMTSTYKQLRDKLVKLQTKLSELLEKKSKEINKTIPELKTLAENHLFANDKLLLGFIPVMKYMHKRTIWSNKLMQGEEEQVARLCLIVNLMNSLGLGTTEAKSEKDDLFSLDGIGGEVFDKEVKKHLVTFGETNLNQENRTKHLIILDGQNVAIRYGDTRFISKGIKLAIDYWVERGHQVHVLLPDYFFNKEEVALKKQLAQSKGDSLKHIPDDVDLLLDLKAKGFAFGIPNWNYDDSYIIDYAKKKNGFIVTNDRYNDHIENYSKGDQNKKKKLKDWIRNNCISFTFIGDEFMPNPDFLNEHMK